MLPGRPLARFGATQVQWSLAQGWCCHGAQSGRLKLLRSDAIADFIWRRLLLGPLLVKGKSTAFAYCKCGFFGRHSGVECNLNLPGYNGWWQ